MTGPAPEAGNTPAPLTSFVGRRKDIAEVRRRLRSARLLTLTGVGGVGKTRLALEVAAVSRRAFPGGVWLVDLTTVTDPDTVPSAAAAALGVADAGDLPLLERVATHLAHRKALLVLDNCEHLADACAELALTLLPAAPRLRVLATSRLSLGIIGEELFTVAPLPADDAVALLLDRADALRPGFRSGAAADPGAVDRLCAGLDRLPLTIELAACRLRTLSVGQLTDRLDDRFTLLTGSAHARRPQQRTLRALVDWSYELCSPAERLLWTRLSVFTGSFGLEAAEAVCAGDGIATPDVLDLLARLVAQSVVLPVDEAGTRRYTLLETIRQYGRQRLAHSGTEPAVLRRHLDYFRTFAEQLAEGWFGPGQEETLARLRIEHGNLMAALEYGTTAPAPETSGTDPRRPGKRQLPDSQAALALAGALRFHWCAGGFLGEGRRRLGQILAAAPEPTPARATALWVAGWAALLQGDHRAAEDALAAARRLGERLDDPRVCAYVEGFCGALAMFQGRLPESARRFESAVTTFNGLGDASGTLFWLFQLAVVKTLLREPGAAEIARHGVALAEARGERLCRSYLLMALAFEAWTRGDNETGEQLARAGLEVQRSFNDPIGSGMLLGLLAWLATARGEHECAARLLGTVDALWRRNTTSITAFGPHMSGIQERNAEEARRVMGRTAYERACAEGGRHDTPGRAIADALATASGPGAPAVSAEGALTRREQEVAALVAKGLSNRQIAGSLQRSPRTVEGHVENILAKLGFASRAQIAVWWAAHQLPCAQGS